MKARSKKTIDIMLIKVGPPILIEQANLTSKHGEGAIRWYIDVSGFFGDGKWLTTVQAHSLKEKG